MSTAVQQVTDPLGPPAPISRSERSLAPDIARGGMLLFIALANVPIHLWGMGLDEYNHNTGQSGADHLAYFVEQLLIAERSRPMFAILYGFGIAVMASRMFANGMGAKGVRTILRRRSLWLIAFGFLHSTFLFFGDVLASYGAVGLLALFLVHLSDRDLKRWLWGSLAYTAVIGTPIMAYSFTISGDPPRVEGLGPYVSQLATGAFASPVGSLAMVVTGSFFPLIIAGMMLQRTGMLNHPEAHLPRLRRLFVSGMAVGVASALPIALIALGLWAPAREIWIGAIYLTLIGGMYAGLGYICGFALLAHKLRSYGRRGAPGALAAVGERSLTSYLLQSVIMAPLLTAWGFGLGEDLGYLGAFGYAFGTWLVTVVIALALDKAGKRGPFEVVLRRLTYGRKQS